MPLQQMCSLALKKHWVTWSLQGWLEQARFVKPSFATLESWISLRSVYSSRVPEPHQPQPVSDFGSRAVPRQPLLHSRSRCGQERHHPMALATQPQNSISYWD